MIKLGMKNYFRSFRYFFVPLGVLSLGIVIALSIAVPQTLDAVKAFITDSAEQMGKVSFNWEGVRDLLISTFRIWDWSGSGDIFKSVFTKEFLMDLLHRCADVALGDTSAIASQMESLASETAGKIFGALFLGVSSITIGAFFGFFVTRIEIRKEMAQRSVGKLILASVVDSIIKVTVLALGLWLIEKTVNYAMASFALTVVLYGLISLFEAYIVHGFKKVPLRKVINLKNAGSLALLTAIECVFAGGVFLGLYFIANPLIALYIAYALAVLTLSCIQLNAEAYVKSLANSVDGTLNLEGFAAAYASLAPHTAHGKKKAPNAAAPEEEAEEALKTPYEEDASEAPVILADIDVKIDKDTLEDMLDLAEEAEQDDDSDKPEVPFELPLKEPEAPEEEIAADAAAEPQEEKAEEEPPAEEIPAEQASEEEVPAALEDETPAPEAEKAEE